LINEKSDIHYLDYHCFYLCFDWKLYSLLCLSRSIRCISCRIT